MHNNKHVGCITCNREIPFKICLSFIKNRKDEIIYIAFYDSIIFNNLNNIIKKYNIELLLVQKELYLVIEGSFDVEIYLLDRSEFKETKKFTEEYFINCSISALIQYSNLQNIKMRQEYLDDRAFVLNDSHDNIFDLVNFTSTSYGRRRLKLDLMQPLLLIDQITSRHEKILYFRNNPIIALNIEKQIKLLPDIERILNSNYKYNDDLKGYRKLIYNTVKIYNFVVSYNNMKEYDTFFKFDVKEYLKKFNMVLNSQSYDLTQIHELFNCLNNDYLKLAIQIHKEILDSIDDYLKSLSEVLDFTCTKNNRNELILKVTVRDKSSNFIKMFEKTHTEYFNNKSNSPENKNFIDSSEFIEHTKGHNLSYKNTFKFPSDFIVLTQKNDFFLGTTLELQKLNYKLNEVCDQIIEIGGNMCIDLLLECKLDRKHFNDILNEISEIDLCISAYKFSLKYVCCISNICDRLCIASSYNPYLNKTKIIYNDIYLSDLTRLNILTGPNMNGKSAYAKQIYYSALLYQIGYPITAKNGVQKIFDKIIYKSNSTVSSENIYKFIDRLNLNERSLFILDELGKTVLYQHILPTYLTISRHILNTKCYSVIITHHTEFIGYILDLEGVNILKSIQFRVTYGFYNHKLIDVIEIMKIFNISLDCDIQEDRENYNRNLSKLAFDIKQCNCTEDEEKIVKDIQKKFIHKHY